MQSRYLAASALAAALIVAGCADPQARNQAGAGVASGAIAAIAANALGANNGWTVAAGVAGAAAGSLYARNQQTNQCAYHTGDGQTVRVGAC